MTNRNNLREQILEHAVLHGEFTLRSGTSSSYYIDKYEFETRPELLRKITAAFVELINEQYPDVERLAVPALGGVPLGSTLSVEMDRPMIIVRKEQKDHGTGSQIEGPFNPGDRVLIVEDIVTTAGEAIRTLNALREEKLDVMGVTCVVNRQEGGEENLAEEGVELRSLFTASGLGLK